MRPHPRAYRWLELGVRLVVGAAFMYAGALKIGDPLQFADQIASFEILPNALINPLALSLPLFEILTGLLLITGLMRRPAALAIALALAVYLAAISWALARGLTIDCGCFGAQAPSRAGMWLDLARDVALLAGAVIAYRYPGAKWHAASQELSQREMDSSVTSAIGTGGKQT